MQRDKGTEKKSRNSLDSYIGHRVRLRRKQLGLSQERLARFLGITFQQVQKYEKGLNRIGAGRLLCIADALSADISFFYRNAPRPSAFSGQVNTLAEQDPKNYISGSPADTSEEVELLRQFSKISSDRVRENILALITSLSEGQYESDQIIDSLISPSNRDSEVNVG